MNSQKRTTTDQDKVDDLSARFAAFERDAANSEGRTHDDYLRYNELIPAGEQILADAARIPDPLAPYDNWGYLTMMTRILLARLYSGRARYHFFNTLTESEDSRQHAAQALRDSDRAGELSQEQGETPTGLPHGMRISCLIDVGNYGQALQDALRKVEPDPSDDNYLVLANVYHSTGNLAQAIAAATQACDRAFNDHQLKYALEMRARYHRESGDHAAAERDEQLAASKR